MRRISWQQLEYFLVVARNQNISRAAIEIGLTQPALSRAIANLEANIELPLFQRAGRSIALTRFGDVFRRRVERALGEIDEGKRELDDLVSADRGMIELGFVSTLGVDFIPNAVRRFKDRYPNVRFAFAQSNTDELETKLLNGELDLIFTPKVAGDAANGISWSIVGEQELILIIPHSHQLVSVRKVALSDLSAEQFVSLKKGHRFRQFTDSLCNQAGFTPHYSFEGDDLSSLIGFVSAGFGIAIVPPVFATSPRVASLRLVKPIPRRSIGVKWIDGHYLSASARLFRDFVLADRELQLLADRSRSLDAVASVVFHRDIVIPKEHITKRRASGKRR
jgi:LysR family transcriptional activator of glutamate synthase operon